MWYKAPIHGDIIESVHIAPQTWKDGSRQELYIKAMALETLPDEIKAMIQFEHCIVVGGYNKETIEEGMVWAEHCTEEIGNWGVFLPELYNLYRVVLETRYNPFSDLTVERKGKEVRYKYMP